MTPTEKTWYVIDTAENGKHYAFAHAISHVNNLLSAFEHLNASTANACKTKREACDIAAAWNETYKRNGTYLYASPLF